MHVYDAGSLTWMRGNVDLGKKLGGGRRKGACHEYHVENGSIDW